MQFLSQIGINFLTKQSKVSFHMCFTTEMQAFYKTRSEDCENSKILKIVYLILFKFGYAEIPQN